MLVTSRFKLLRRIRAQSACENFHHGLKEAPSCPFCTVRSLTVTGAAAAHLRLNWKYSWPLHIFPVFTESQFCLWEWEKNRGCIIISWNNISSFFLEDLCTLGLGIIEERIEGILSLTLSYVSMLLRLNSTMLKNRHALPSHHATRRILSQSVVIPGQ